MTVSEVAARAARGSEIGIRKSLARLVEQGIVRSTDMGRNRVHELNREHLAAPVAELLSGLRIELWKRLRGNLSKWRPRPVYACAFGSAARGDGGPESDIDLLLVHPHFPGEKRPTQANVRSLLGAIALDLAIPATTKADVAKWARHVEGLHSLVYGWTGNRLQAIDLSAHEWTQRTSIPQSLRAEIDRDAIVLIQPNPIASVAERSQRLT